MAQRRPRNVVREAEKRQSAVETQRRQDGRRRQQPAGAPGPVGTPKDGVRGPVGPEPRKPAVRLEGTQGPIGPRRVTSEEQREGRRFREQRVFQEAYEQSRIEAKQRLARSLTLAGKMQTEIEPGFFVPNITYNERPLGLEWASVAYMDEDGNTVYGIDPEAVRPMMSPGQRGLENVLQRVSGSKDARIYGQFKVSPEPDYIGADDKYLTETDAMRQLYSADVNELALLKTKLIQLELLDPKDAGQFGIRDITSAVEAGFANLVALSQQNNMRWAPFMDTSIDQGIKFGGGGSGRGGGGGGGGGYTIRLTSADNLKQIADQVAQQRIGRRLDDESLNRFVSTYQDMERQFQTAYYNNAAEVEEAPTADAAAQTQISELFRSEEDLYSVGSTLDMFTQIVGG